MNPSSFVHEPLASRILFGFGVRTRIGDEAGGLGIERALVLSTPGQADQAARVRDLLGSRCAGVFAGAKMHTPEDVTAVALRALAACAADGLVAIGGGSTTGLSKALALRTDLPQLILPTTYAGSEVTAILGETRGGVKTTQRSPRVVPETVIYDVELTLGLPVAISVTSGLNAIAHAAEALYAADSSPIVALMAEEGIRTLISALPRIAAQPDGQAARHDALYGAWLCGTTLGMAGMALHHKLCHILGGSFDLPHAETHGVVLPHALAYNLPAAPLALERLRRATGWTDPAVELHRFAARLGAPTSLASLGMPEAGIAQAAELALGTPYPNPRPIERDAIMQLIARAWRGDAPAPLAAGGRDGRHR